jgi:hypothetical protein
MLLLHLLAVASTRLLHQLRSKPDSVLLLLWLLLICCVHEFAARCRLALLQAPSLFEINLVTV